MRYKLEMTYSNREKVLKKVESPIFNFPNPILAGSIINIYGGSYYIIGGDNSDHTFDENGAYTILSVTTRYPFPESELEGKLNSARQDFAKLEKNLEIHQDEQDKNKT